MPMAVAILFCLFAVQGRGTARIGTVFGPLMLLWFVVIAVQGLGGILHHARRGRPATALLISAWFCRWTRRQLSSSTRTRAT